jgi:hypothetical protein
VGFKTSGKGFLACERNEPYWDEKDRESRAEESRESNEHNNENDERQEENHENDIIEKTAEAARDVLENGKEAAGDVAEAAEELRESLFGGWGRKKRSTKILISKKKATSFLKR